MDHNRIGIRMNTYFDKTFYKEFGLLGEQKEFLCGYLYLD